MLSVATYPVSRSIATAAPRPGGALAYIRAASLSVWLISLVVLMWKYKDFDASVEWISSGYRTTFYVGFGICVAMHLTLGFAAWAAAPFELMSTWSGMLFTIFCASSLLLSPLSLIPTTTAIYAVATWGVYVLLYLYWQSDYRIVRRMTVFAGFCLQVWFFILLLKHGLSAGFGSGIGGINRNASSSAVFAGMICCLMSPKKSVRLAAIASCFFMATLVTSRGSIVATIAFLVTYYTVNKGTVRAAVRVTIGIVVLCAAMLAIPSINHLLFDQVFMLHDEGRGMAGGFSGRFDIWKNAVPVAMSHPIFGHGFRTSSHAMAKIGGVHSGYLMMVMDTGFVGAFFIIGAVAAEAVRRFRLTMRFRTIPPGAVPMNDVTESLRVNSVACATIIMMFVLWAYEPLYVNTGTPIMIVFFLMMVAPAHIPKNVVRTR